jgi:hypothetical protein
MKKKQLIKKYKEYILDEIRQNQNNRTDKRGRPLSHSYSYYLNKILKVLFYGHTWESLTCVCNISTIKRHFYKLRDYGIFQNAYYKLFEKYIQEKGRIEMLFIDATIIGNKNANEHIDIGKKIKGKKSSSLTALVTEDRITVAYTITESKSHDIVHLDTIVDNIPKNISISYHNPLYIVGDKGYISNERKLKYKKKNIILVYPNRKNAVKKTTYRNKQILKKRFVVEASFAHLKNGYQRLQVRYDRQTRNYETFLIMAFSCQIIKYLCSKRKFGEFLTNNFQI